MPDPTGLLVVNDYLEAEITVHMESFVWLKPYRTCLGQSKTPRKPDELLNALQEEWQRIPRMNIRRLIRSMHPRCNAVIRARGGHTEY